MCFTNSTQHFLAVVFINKRQYPMNMHTGQDSAAYIYIKQKCQGQRFGATGQKHTPLKLLKWQWDPKFPELNVNLRLTRDYDT